MNKTEKYEFQKELSKEEAKKHKGFHITITDLNEGKVMFDEDTKAIIGAFDKGTGVQGVSMTVGNQLLVMQTLDTVEKIVIATKKQVVLSLLKSKMEGSENE